MTSPTTTMTELAAATAGLNLFEALTRDTLSLNVFPKSTREEFKTSFGTQWSTKVGKYTLWDLKGVAEETWNRVLFPRALDILRNNPIDPRKLSGLSDRPSAALHGWMVGLDQDHAHPTMVLVSEDRKYRDEAQRLMKKKKALKDTGFRMMALAARIERDGGSPQSEGEFDLHDVTARTQTEFEVDMYGSKISRSPKSLDVTNVPLAGNAIYSNKASATIGGQIMVNDLDFAVTVAHVFKPFEVVEPIVSNAMLEFDDDGFSSDSSDTESSPIESEDEVQVLELQGLHRRHDESIQRHTCTNDLDAGYETETTSDHISPSSADDGQTLSYSEKSALSMNELCDSDAYMVDHSIDCALISVQKFSNILNLAQEIPNVLPRFISSKGSPSLVWAIGDSLLMKGWLQRSLCAIKPEGSDHFIQTLAAQLDSPLRPGNCGSWFVDQYNHAMVGMLISGCRSLKLAYLLPGETLQEKVEEFANASARLKQFRLQTQTANDAEPSFSTASTEEYSSLSANQSSGTQRSWVAFDDSGFKSGQISVENSLEVLSSKAFQIFPQNDEWGYLRPVGDLDWIFLLKTHPRYCERPTQEKASWLKPGVAQQSKEHESLAYSLSNGSVAAYLVGRDPTCDIRVQVSKVSKVSNIHCSIFCTVVDGKTTVFVSDFSTNGTFVNQQKDPLGPNKTQQLFNGDRISLGKNLDFLFYAPREIRREIYSMQYILQELLGKGHSSQVYLCTKKQTGVCYATRISSGRDIASNQSIKVHITLSHPSILALKDVFIEGENTYQVYEFAPEGDLFNLIVTKQKLSEKEACKVFQQLFSAVKHLHDRNIMHRDIKPEHILVMDKDLTVKLGGFSLAYMAGRQGTDNTLCGTPSYVAPEILEESSKREYTKAVDIWSLGVVLYICLCGFPPFSDELNTEENPYALSQQIKMGRFDYPSPYWDSVGDPALDLIDRMLTVDVTKRPTIEECMQHPWMMQGGVVGSLLTFPSGLLIDALPHLS